MTWIYELATWQTAVLFALFFVGLTWAGILATRTRVRRWLGPQPGHNDVVGLILGGYGVFYGVMLGLLAVGTYENFCSVEEVVHKEAACLNALNRDVSGYPEPLRGELRGLVHDYCRHIVEEAWPEQRRGIVPTGGTPLADAIQARLLAFEPAAKGQEILHAETLRKFNEASELRRLRVQNVSQCLPGELWAVVLAGAFLNILLTWMLSLEKLSVHLALSGILSLFIGLVLFLIAEMDHPLQGSISVSPEPFEILLQHWARS